MTSSRTIRETPVTPTHGGHTAGTYAYRLPNRACATCGQSTSKSLHEKCRRIKGHLVVVEGKP